MQTNNIEEVLPDIIENESHYQKSVREHQELIQQMGFHNKMITQLKGRLGNKCSYLSWQRYEDEYGIKAVIDGDQVDVMLGGTPKDVGYEEYENLFEKLSAYEKED